MIMQRRLMLGLGAAALVLPRVVLGEDTATDDAPAASPAVKDYSLGDPDAPVKITEYASYTCPHCARFNATVFPDLKSDYIDTGKVRYTLREVYFDRYGLWAALVARCGGDMRYFGISGMLFAQQEDWAADRNPQEAVRKLRMIGLSAGLTNDQLDICLSDAALIDAMVKHYEKNMEADDIEGTPTLIINGEKHGNMSYGSLKTLIDAELEG